MLPCFGDAAWRIDTYPHGGKWLTCLDCETDNVIQASQDAEVREFPLSKYS